MQVRSILVAVLSVPVVAFGTTITLHFFQGNIPRSVISKNAEKHRAQLPPVPVGRVEVY